MSTTETHSWRERTDAARMELEDFKGKVVTVGERYAQENNLCSEYDDFLDELGLQRPAIRVRARVTVTIEVEADFVGSNRDSALDADYFHSSLRRNVGDLASDMLDSDWDGVVVDDISWSVQDIDPA